MHKKVFSVILAVLVPVIFVSFVFCSNFQVSGIAKGLNFVQEIPEQSGTDDGSSEKVEEFEQSGNNQGISNTDNNQGISDAGNDEGISDAGNNETGSLPDVIIDDDEPLGKTYAWWYKRNLDNRQPETDPNFITKLENRGCYVGDPSQKKIYLTFDEGYENGYTADILDILKDNDVKAAFFITGKYIDKQPELVKRMVAEGHIVGNHTENHPSMPALSNEEIKEELEAVSNKFKALTGETMQYLRPPKGEFNSRTLNTGYRLGYQTIFWSLALRDWDINNQLGEEKTYQSVMDNVHNGAIILLHAVSESNRDALDRILKDLFKAGYSFASLDELQ
ncbi:delta-lactam-biosynthetic de-N-acetylase [Phosphitispora sp. TUW77]|uniref:delta-lactam-biosynthetic de-N-acetylase n=1 Tax=Phosphitispora sp. TUW77 TaxID=3152361 RepID=UPI003AB28285